jgi:pyridoxal phosphate enzyme (YggS family)
VGSADMEGLTIQKIAASLRGVERRIAAAADKAGRSPDEVTLIAVTKGLPLEAVEAAIEAGIEHIGENRVQEASTKVEQASRLGLHPTWHLIGHLQRNKAKTAVGVFDIIHSVDSLKLAETLNAVSASALPVLLQVNVSGEATKSGFSVAELHRAMTGIGRLSNLMVTGLMTIAPLTSDPEEARPVFRKLREARDSMGLEHLSMGMTDDFEVAVEEGATMVRIGRAIFGG